MEMSIHPLRSVIAATIIFGALYSTSYAQSANCSISRGNSGSGTCVSAGDHVHIAMAYSSDPDARCSQLTPRVWSVANEYCELTSDGKKYAARLTQVQCDENAYLAERDWERKLLGFAANVALGGGASSFPNVPSGNFNIGYAKFACSTK